MDNSPVLEKGDATIEELETEKPIFRFIFAEWCGHCTRAKPVWKNLVKQHPTINKKVIQYDLLDSEDPINTAIVKKFKVTSFPYFVLENKGNTKVFSGERTVSGFLKFLEKEI